MAKLKNPEVNEVLFNMDEERAAEERRISDEERYARIDAEEERKAELERMWDARQKQKDRIKLEQNQALIEMDPNYDQQMEGKRRGVFYDDHRNIDDEHHINVYEERPEGAYVGELVDTVYQDGSSSTYWGASTTIPEHWSNKQAEGYLELRANGYKMSEKLFDSYLRSGAENLGAFLAQIKKEQIDEAWRIPDAFARVRGKVHKNEADNKSSKLLSEYKREPYSNKKEEVDIAWTQHENAEKSAKAQADKLTAKQIKGFMREQNG